MRRRVIGLPPEGDPRVDNGKRLVIGAVEADVLDAPCQGIEVQGDRFLAALSPGRPMRPGPAPAYSRTVRWRRSRVVEHEHVSMFGRVECTCTDQEAENLALITAYRAARVADRKQFFAPGYRRHRAAFQNIGDITGVHHHGDEAMVDRRNVVLDMTAKGDKVWAIWRVVGHHTGDWYGIPATGRPVDVIEAGMWRVENGLIAEAWFFGDELALLRQLGLFPGIGPL